jgi:Domain of unknown function (DUF4331)
MLRAIRSAPASVRHGLAAIAAVGVMVLARASNASDHQDTPEVELKQLNDINDVYAFPGVTPGRIVLALTTASPVTPAQSATIGFDPGQLYQIRIDNTGDAVEDLVLQFTFTGSGPNQQVAFYGPAAPSVTGAVTTRLMGASTLTGPVNTVLTRYSAAGRSV